MQDRLTDADITVTPIVFEEESREAFTHRQSGDDLILQVFPRHRPDNLGARAFSSTLSERSG